jgi:hypothetical protein
MTTNDGPPSGSLPRSVTSSISEESSSASEDHEEKCEVDPEFTHNQDAIPGRSLVSDDVVIPAGILRAANRSTNRASDVEDEEKSFPAQPGTSEDFSILDIAYQQRQQVGEALVDINTGRADVEHHNLWNLEAGTRGDQWSPSTLPTVEEGTQLGPAASSRRWSARRSMPVRTASNNSARRELGRTGSNSSTQRQTTAVSVSSRNDAVLYRSLSGYTMKHRLSIGGRRVSESIAPDVDYIDLYKDPFTSDADQSMISPRSSATFTRPTTGADEGRIQNARKDTLSRLCVRGRNESVIGPAVRKVTQGATDLTRRNSLLDVYDKAKIRGQQLQRKRWVQWTFEYACYLLIICFIYFVLVGRPIWNGAVWWLYWVVNNKFTVAGTWSVTIGMALL